MGNGKEYEGVRYPSRIAQAAAPAPGRASSASSLPAASGPPGPSGIQWGAGIKTATVQHTIGNDWVDRGPGCDDRPPGTSGCFLDPGQRQRIATAYQARVNAAQTAYVGALTALRVDELVRKEPEKVDWVFEVLLDVVGIVVSDTVKRVAKLIAGGHTEGIEMVVTNAAAATHEAEGAGAYLEHAIGAGVSAQKQQAVAAHAAHKPEMSARKEAAVGFLDMLAQASAQIYEYLREDAIAGVSDSALVIAFDSFRASNGHAVGDYKTAVGKKLDRFKDSGMHMIGVQTNETFDPLAMQIGAGGPDSWQKHETRAFWVKTPVGQRLGLYRRGYRPVDGDDEKKRLDLKDRPFMFWRFVPRDFEGVALQMHHARWGDTPGDHTCGIDELAQMGDGLEQP